MQPEWREKYEQRALAQKMSIYGAESEKSVIVWTQTTVTQSKIGIAVFGGPTSTATWAERASPSLLSGCKKILQASWLLLPPHHEPILQVTKQRQLFFFL